MEVIGVLISLGLSLLIIISILMLGRGIVCWYLKINDRLLLDQGRNMLLRDIAKKMDELIEIGRKQSGDASTLDNPGQKS